jgi:hypothetical protein
VSVDFKIEGTRIDLDDPATFVNLHNGNAREVLEWLGLDSRPYGEIAAADLASRCWKRLGPSADNVDAGRPGAERGRLITGGRKPGALPRIADQLLELCERAILRGYDRVTWG